MIPLPKEDVTPPVTNTYLVEFDMRINVTTGRKVNRFLLEMPIFKTLIIG